MCGGSLNANMFLCHLFSLSLILPKSLSFHTSIHFSSLPLNAFLSQPDSDGGACVFEPQRCWWGNRRQQIVLKLFNLRFLACSCARNSAPQHNSVPLDSHQPPVPHSHPSTQSSASLHSWRVAGLTVYLSWDTAWRKMKCTWCFLLDDLTPIFLLPFICLCYSDLSLKCIYAVITLAKADLYNVISANRVTVKLL